MFCMVYVFDTRIESKDDYVVRVPEFLAKLICKRRGFWDYAPTPAGL